MKRQKYDGVLESALIKVDKPLPSDPKLSSRPALTPSSSSPSVFTNGRKSPAEQVESLDHVDARLPGPEGFAAMPQASVKQQRSGIDLPSFGQSIVDMRRSQEELLHFQKQILELQMSIQQELKDANASLPAAQASKDDSLCISTEHLRKILEETLSKSDPKLHQQVSPDSMDHAVPEETANIESRCERMLVAPDPASQRRVVAEQIPVRTQETFDRSVTSCRPLPSEEPGLCNQQTFNQNAFTSHLSPIHVWHEFQAAIEGTDPDSVYRKVLIRKSSETSIWHNVFDNVGAGHFVRKQAPATLLARIIDHPLFVVTQTLLILVNTCLLAYQMDLTMKAMLTIPRGEVPTWLDDIFVVFNIVFVVEVVFRIVALRSWFFVAPNEWAWNVFDLVIVICSVVFDVFHTGVTASYVRTLRILRVLRVARILRVLRVFRQLRQMMYSIVACLISLAWAFSFLLLINFMFSMVCMEGAEGLLEDIQSSKRVESEKNREYRLRIEAWFGSLPSTMISLLASVTGGVDWWDVYDLLSATGNLYSAAYTFYVLFVIVGVMNVLTGVFLQNANEFFDIDLIVQGQLLQIEAFCSQMIEIFNEFDVDKSGKLSWEQFRLAMSSSETQAYLASLGLEPTHVRLVYELLDRDSSGDVSLEEFVMGMVKLKGEAKAIDARIIQREVGMIPNVVKHELMKYGIAGDSNGLTQYPEKEADSYETQSARIAPNPERVQTTTQV